jgi:hypothetical protein
MSRGARAYAIDIVLSKLIVALIEFYPDIPVCSHEGGLPAAVRAIWDRWKCFEDQVFLPMSAMAKRYACRSLNPQLNVRYTAAEKIGDF